MSVATAQKTREDEQQETVSEQQSLTLMKNLFRTAISSISYVRNLFPSDCFREKNLTGLHIHSLVPKTEEARLIIEWVERGVNDALQKRFLDEVVFGVYDRTNEQEHQLLECYNFRVSYSDEVSPNGVLMSYNTANGKGSQMLHAFDKEQIKNQTVSMIRTLVTLTSTLKPLPKERYLTMRLTYRDDVTPDEYEPELFRAAEPEDAMRFKVRPCRIKVGEVVTGHHQMTLKVKTTENLGDETFSSSVDAAEDNGDADMAPEPEVSVGDKKEVLDMDEDLAANRPSSPDLAQSDRAAISHGGKALPAEKQKKMYGRAKSYASKPKPDRPGVSAESELSRSFERVHIGESKHKASPAVSVQNEGEEDPQLVQSVKSFLLKANKAVTAHTLVTQFDIAHEYAATLLQRLVSAGFLHSMPKGRFELAVNDPDFRTQPEPQRSDPAPQPAMESAFDVLRDPRSDVVQKSPAIEGSNEYQSIKNHILHTKCTVMNRLTSFFPVVAVKEALQKMVEEGLVTRNGKRYSLNEPAAPIGEDNANKSVEGQSVPPVAIVHAEEKADNPNNRVVAKLGEKRSRASRDEPVAIVAPAADNGGDETQLPPLSQDPAAGLMCSQSSEKDTMDLTQDDIKRRKVSVVEQPIHQKV